MLKLFVINEQTDIYISKSVTILVRLPNTKKKSYLKTVINLYPANVSLLYSVKASKNWWISDAFVEYTSETLI